MEMYHEFTAGPAIFQMGVPAQETFPAKLFARIRSHAVRAESSAAQLRLRTDGPHPFNRAQQEFE
jgi:hypothetical protein